MKRDLLSGAWNDQGIVIPTRQRVGYGDRSADAEWRQQADEGGCADWGLAFARIPTAPLRDRTNRREKWLGAIALLLVAIGGALLLIAEGRLVWPL